jgi:hypothetical protein
MTDAIGIPFVVTELGRDLLDFVQLSNFPLAFPHVES